MNCLSIGFSKRLFVSLLFILTTVAKASATQDPIIDVLSGASGQLTVGASMIVTDDKYYDVGLNSMLSKPYSVKSIVRLKINEYFNKILSDSSAAEIKLRIYKYGEDNDLNHPIDTVETVLRVDYNVYGKYVNHSAFVLEDVHQIKVEILEIDTSSSSNLLSALMLSVEMEPSPVYKFDCSRDTIETVSTITDSISTQGELMVKWSNVVPADEYDLEWTFIDKDALDSGLYNINGILSPNLLFENNATRVTVSSTDYLIPLLYDGNGSLFYRVRPVSVRKGNNVVASSWTPPGEFVFSGHERNLNWQSSISFAEEGKRKIVINYFDGSLRSRQTVTKDNTTNTTVVAESFYDFQGRPVVQVLPSPTISNIVQYAVNFNVGINGAKYDKLQFDSIYSPNDFCSISANPLGNTSGTAKYYSTSNPENSGLNKFIPDAKGFVFSETQFEQDNTGRIKSQSGVGEAFKLNGGHDTRYFYSTPDQNELDALFGTEVGYSEHYFKNVVKDANGQYSVSYVDMHGRTIATALAGPSPNNLDALPSNQPDTITETISNNKVASINDLSIVNRKTVVVPKADDYQFKYRLDPQSVLLKNCDTTSICYDCLYNLEITITDDCNNQKIGGTPIKIVRTNLPVSNSLIAGACSTDVGFAVDTTFHFEVGSYEVTKVLTISKFGMDYLRDTLFSNNNTCINLDSVVKSQTSFYKSGISNCVLNCETCNANLASWETFRNQFMLTAKVSIEDSANYRSNAWQAYLNEKKSCDELCNKTTEYNSIRESMIQDMTAPSGQYAFYVNESLAEPNDTTIQISKFSIFYTEYGPNDNTEDPNDEIVVKSPVYQNSNIIYLDATGKPDFVFDQEVNAYVKPQQLSPESFIANFKPSWAEALLPFHPEYCKLLQFEQFQSSLLWDQTIDTIQSYATAYNFGLLSPTSNSVTGPGKDPLASLSTDFANSLNTKLSNYTGFPAPKTSQNLTLVELVLAQVTCKSLASTNTGYKYDSACIYSTAVKGKVNFNHLECDSDKDMAWNIFKNMYIQIKRSIVDAHMKNNVCINSIPSDTLLAYGHSLNFRNTQDAIKQAGLGDFSTVEGINAAINDGKTKSASYQSDVCLNYVWDWYNQLGPCNYTSSDSAIIIPRLLAVCRKGTDLNHMQGASSIAPDSFYQYKSFEQVIDEYNKQNNITNVYCNANLIKAPLPYNKQAAYSDKPILTKPDSCECENVNRYYKEYKKLTVAQKLFFGNFSGYLLKKYKTEISSSDISKLIALCNPQPTMPKCLFTGNGLVLPPIFQCNINKPCASCDDIKVAMYSYKQKFGLDYMPKPLLSENDTVQSQKNILFENYMNNQLGFAYVWSDYLSFKYQCDTALGHSGFDTTYTDSLNKSCYTNSFTAAPKPSWINNDTLVKIYNEFKSLYPSSAGNSTSVNTCAGFDTTLTCTSLFEWYFNKRLGFSEFDSSIIRRWIAGGGVDTTVSGGANVILSYSFDEVLPQANWPTTSNNQMKSSYAKGDSCYSIYGKVENKNFKFQGYSGRWAKAMRLDSKVDVDAVFILPPLHGFTYLRYFLRGADAQKAVNYKLEYKAPGSSSFTLFKNLQYVARNNSNDSAELHIDTLQGIPNNSIIRFVVTKNQSTAMYIDSLSSNGRTGVIGGSSGSGGNGASGCKSFTDSTYFHFTYNDYITWLQSADTALIITTLPCCTGNLFTKSGGAGVSIDSSSYNSLMLCSKAEPLDKKVTVPEINSCSDSTSFAISTGKEILSFYSDSIMGKFDSVYLAKCLNAYKYEEFTVTHAVSEYHYTLYYYDQAGNLVKTVPPQGVKPNRNPIWLAQVKQARNNKAFMPNSDNYLPTTYRYNTLNQVTAQKTPDADKSYFWYDRLGRLAISQNANQADSNKYSYTLYDSLGRTTEVGQINSATKMDDTISRNPVSLDDWLSSAASSKEQITVTVYDKKYSSLTPVLNAKNLRNRVSYSLYFNTASDMNLSSGGQASATYYSYDIHGNVDTLVQDNNQGAISIANRFKKISYEYDLISGKVNNVSYQAGMPDQFYHKYIYDAENRITEVYTSADNVIWEKDARYQYYKHGPLSRSVIGQQQVQGIDYAYTLQGWLKGVNGTAAPQSAEWDMKGDGAPGTITARDAYSFALHYYEYAIDNIDYTDYAPIGSGVKPFASAKGAGTSFRSLYNGNIAAMSVNMPKIGEPFLYTYKYDQLNRITSMLAHTGLNATTNTWTPISTDKYQEVVTYDANGNILTYKRNGAGTGSNPLEMDDLVYQYPKDTAGNILNNRLRYVYDTIPDGNYTEDIDSQTPLSKSQVLAEKQPEQGTDNFQYDKIGNLVKDIKSGIESISWTVYGKISSILKTDGTKIEYTYDPAGNRISKSVDPSGDGPIAKTYYVRDASGNVMSVYTSQSTTILQSEVHLYGSSRIGIFNLSRNPNSTIQQQLFTFERGNKFFELSNHLQNVLVTISDKKIGIDADNNGQIDYYVADVTSAQDFYPFGFKMPGRQWSNGTYRYGFNGREEDDEVKGDGNQLDYKMRIYDPRLGRFLSVDPIADEYPQLTPYQFASNQPIESVDMDGLERMDYRAIKGDDGKAKLTLVSEGPKEWKGTLLGFTINKVTIPHHIRVEYNGQHYVFDDGGRNSPVTKLPAASGYGQYPDAVHYAADYDKFLANPDEFVKTHRSEEKEVEEWDEALRKVEMAADIAEAIADGVSSGRGGRGRSPRMPRIKTPKPSTSTNKPAMQQKVAATPNTAVKQKAAAQQKAIVKPPSGKAPEFERGQTTETGFLNSAMNWLGKGYKYMGNGRYLSADGLRQVRYGKHETDPKKRHHGHFESYDKPADKGGVVTETATVEIVPDKKN